MAHANQQQIVHPPPLQMQSITSPDAETALPEVAYWIQGQGSFIEYTLLVALNDTLRGFILT